MTNYNDGRWHGWNGGECPVHPKTLVEGIYLDPETNDVDHGSPVTDPASEFDWDRSGILILVAFRVVKEYREPREFWLLLEGAPYGHWVPVSKDTPGAVLFREVIE